MRAKEIQKAPYDEKAVAPNVFPAVCDEAGISGVPGTGNVRSRQKRTGELPHACEQLCKSSVAECETDNDVRDGDAACARVVEGENKGGRRKCHQTQRGRVGELAVEDGDWRTVWRRRRSGQSRLASQQRQRMRTHILAAKGQKHGLLG